MSKNVYNSIYSRLQQIGILDEKGIMQAEYYKFKTEGLMDLNVDNLLYNKIALAHNGIQNGDVMADPDVEVMIYPEKQEAEALSFKTTTLVYIKRFMMVISAIQNLKRILIFFLMTGLRTY